MDMGRRDHLLRIALQANQPQVQEPVTPTGSDDGMEDLELEAGSLKKDKIQQFDVAQGAVLQAIGFMSDEARKKDVDASDTEPLNVASAYQVVSYILPFPFVSQRNQIQVRRVLDDIDCRHFGMGMHLTCLFFEIVVELLDGHCSGLVIRQYLCFNLDTRLACITSNLE